MRARLIALLTLLVALTVAAPAAAQTSASRSQAAWDHQPGEPAASHNGAQPEVRAKKVRGYKLNRAAMKRVLEDAPARTSAGTLTLSVPTPEGGFDRFAIRRTQAMAPELAADHPDIATYAGRSIDDPTASIRLDLTPQGFHASVRESDGTWFVDPYYHRDQSLYASYRGEDVEAAIEFDEREAPLERSADSLFDVPRIDGPNVVLRTYRLALASDVAYAAYHGAADVTAAKVTLINRVNQIYEEDLSIHLELVAGNDGLNFNTAAQLTGANGPCGSQACYTADEVAYCDGPLLDRNRIVLGQVIGADNFDIGHIVLGGDGGGVAYLGYVGDDFKAGGCTGINPPTGDLFAIDYVAHEMGHQFGGPHTFDGVTANCSGGNRNAATSVEPGSGSTVMAYAGICGVDNTQANSDPYFSQKSIEDINDYVTTLWAANTEVQTVSLRNFDVNGDSFRLTYNGSESAAITRGAGYTANAIEAAIEGVSGGVAVTVTGFGGSGQPSDAGFQVTFSGQINRSRLTVTGKSNMDGFVGVTRDGGTPKNGGFTADVTANRAPVVTTPASFTIPPRTFFTLTGEATDADADPLTYLWEQNDTGGGTGTALFNATKTAGPLFRVFAKAAVTNPLLIAPPGQNAAPGTPTRTFPDMAQILSGNTNATSGCPASNVECFSEFLPTTAYAAAMNFRLTARDGEGGVHHSDTVVNINDGVTPFRVTSQNTSSSVNAGTSLPVTWTTGSSGLPGATNVDITLSTDGGLTYPTTILADTPNDGSQSVTVPSVDTTQARIRVQAADGIFFDVSDANLTITPASLAVTDSGDVSVDYSDAPPLLTVNATDGDGDGDQLQLQNVAGLPAGLSLTSATPSADAVRPGTRVWTLTGNVTGAPGTYPVTATVSDGTSSAPVSFSVTVTTEDASVAYSGDSTFSGAQGATTAAVPLEATISDADGATGDLTTATVTFKKGGSTLCSVQAAANGVAACTSTALSAGTHDIDVVVSGGRYAGIGAGSVTVSFPVFTATDSGDASVQYSDALGSLVTVTGTDEDTAGSALTAAAPGLPAGMSLAINGTTANSRTWRVDGATTAAPGAYPVTVTVSDGAGHTAQTGLTITVTREDVTVTDGTDATVQGVEGAPTSPVTLRAGLSETADGAAGDLTKATVTFKKGADTLCTDTSVTAAGAAECVAQLPVGTTAFTIEAGDRYTGTGGDSVQVQAPVFSATDSGDATVQYSDLPAVTVSASDDNTFGEHLQATAPGLPAGLSLVVDTTGAGLPGTRTWKLAGQALAAPAVYPVTVDVDDGQHTTTTAFTITVTAEEAGIAYTGDTSVTGEAGATTASVPLEATVSDADASAGDLTLAAVTFRKGATTLCGPVAPAASGVATCNAVLGAGSHDVDVAVGGRYSGALNDTAVAVSFPAVAQPPAPPAPPTPEPTVAPVVPAAPVIDLSKIGKTVKVKRGRLKLKLVCKGFGRCTGTLKLTAKIKRKTTTIGSVKFTIVGAQAKTLTIKLNAKGRRALRKSLAVKAVAGKVRRSFRIKK